MIRVVFTAVFLFSCLFVPSHSFAQRDSIGWKKQGEAPALGKDLQWINLDEGLALEDLRGRFVLLVFWNASDINSVQVWQDVQDLNERHEDHLTVIGVHSPLFSAQRSPENVREAVDRMQISYPIVNDPALLTWADYSVDVWPTVVLIDPEGDVIFRLARDRMKEDVTQVIDLSRDRYEAQLRIQRKDFPLIRPEHKTILLFPQDVLVDLKGGRIFIADTGHRRILITDLSGKVLDQIGSGNEGPNNEEDGAFEKAQLSEPFGLTIKGSGLFIADRSGHVIRAADLVERRVRTIAGTGNRGFERNPAGDVETFDLNYPQDVLVSGDALYIAMTGLHQVWALDLKTLEVELFAGSGEEGLKDGDAVFSSLAQPRALATDGNTLFIADSSSSSLRQVNIDPPRKMSTLLGKGMFSFADKSGTKKQALMQGPCGVATIGFDTVVSDTLNNKIKFYDDGEESVKTLAGTGQGGFADGPLLDAQFDEPGGIDFSDNKVYVADTNNHAVRIIDLQAGTVSTLELRFD